MLYEPKRERTKAKVGNSEIVDPKVEALVHELTLRQMERDGLVVRTVHPVIPPRVEYRLTDLGSSLGAAFCGVWIWAEQNLERVEAARRAFDERSRCGGSK